ncbi:efflux transporter outer membrane subunit [Undibacterium sp. TC4M20W]|uniref:efflux transporter outer membrane subunit n=1 Tax=Undibacterium sp. TC4M20W TaxID=3413052 RepID=UPI003BF01629
MRRYVIATLSVWCAACTQAPITQVPVMPLAAAYKEAPASASDASLILPAQEWWLLFGDAELNSLQQRLIDNSPDLASALARYRQAQAATGQLRAAELPTLGTSLNGQRIRQSERRPLRVLGPTSPNEYNSATLGLDFQYEIDLWGRVREQVNAGVAEEKAAKADLAAARLSLQATLTDTLVALRGFDEEAAMLSDTVAAYSRAVDMINRRHDEGIASGLDVARVEAQLQSARSQAQQVQAQRAIMEHAIAALVGANASSFSIAPRVVPATTPAIPLGLPSALLQRRPDIAAAQLRIAAASAKVGIAQTAFFPSLNLGAQGGFQSSDFAKFIEMPNLFWAIGPTLAVSLFDGGRRKAQVAGAEAVLDEAGQRYRTTVLGAFQQVEDQLALLSHYGEAAKEESLGAVAAQRALTLAEIRYKQGAVSYLDVIVAQTNALQAQRSTRDLNTRQRRAAVQLVKALGGGWSVEAGGS